MTINKAIYFTVAMLAVCSSIFPQTGLKPWEFSSSVGIVFPGKIEGSYESDFPYNETKSFRNEPLLLLRVGGEYYLHPMVAVAANIYAASIVLEEEVDLGVWDGQHHVIPKDGIYLAEIVLGPKVRFAFTPRITMKAGIYFGYRQTFSSDADARNMGFAFDGNMELSYRVGQNLKALVELGFLSQLYGGIIDVAYIRSGMVPYASVGVGIGM